MAPRRVWLFRAIALSISGVMTFAVAEAIVRIWQMRKQAAARVVQKPDASGRFPGYETPGRNYESQQNFPPMVFDAVTCYRPEPGHVGNGLHINRQGFRYPTELTESSADIFRVFILGGSFAFGAGCPDEATYFRLAEDQLRKRYPNRKIEVVCAAGGAYSSLQEHLTLISRVARYDADLVIFITGANDAYYATRGQRVLDGNDYLSYGAAIRGCIDGHILPRYYYGQVFRDPNAPFPPLYEDYVCKMHWLIDKVRYNTMAPPPRTITVDDVAPREIAADFLYLQRLHTAWGRTKKVPTVVMLQPTISTTTKAKHSHELHIAANHTDDFHGILQAVYEQMEAGLKEQSELVWYDLDDIVSDMSESECFFVDWVHTGENGQRVLASNLADIISDYLKSPVQP